AVTLTGKQLTHLVAKASGLLAITPDAVTQSSGGTGNVFYSTQTWPYDSKSANLWARDKNSSFTANMPSIAVVDSGIQSGRSDFGSRLIASVNLSSLPTAGGTEDGRGHGTFVAGIAADSSSGITGANPAANLVSLKVMDATGMGYTSDIINACQWILDHKAQYNIEVVNLSLHSDITAPFFVDPLDRAVEQLW